MSDSRSTVIREKIVINALSVLVAAMFVGAATVVWQGVMRQETIIQHAVEAEKQRVDAVVEVLTAEVTQIKLAVEKLSRDRAVLPIPMAPAPVASVENDPQSPWFYNDSPEQTSRQADIRQQIDSKAYKASRK